MGSWRGLTRNFANQNPHPSAKNAGRVGPPSVIFTYGNEASAGNTFAHCEVGTPAKLALPVIVEFESQNKSTALPPISVWRLLLPALTSMLDRLASTRPPWPLPVTLDPVRLA